MDNINMINEILQVSLLMILIDPWTRFQGRDIDRHWISQKQHERAIVTIEHY